MTLLNKEKTISTLVHKSSSSILIWQRTWRFIPSLHWSTRRPSGRGWTFLRKRTRLRLQKKPDMPDTMHRVRLVQRNRTLTLCYIFSSNDTCNLDVVGKLLSCLKEKLGIKMLAFKNHSSLSDSTEMCESIIPDLPMDFAIFVVHANEDRFLINEDSAKIYRALLNATGKSLCKITRLIFSSINDNHSSII